MSPQADKKKIALISGITGQDGAYLADFLLQRGYTVHGIKRRSSSLNTDRIDYLYRDKHDAGVRLFLHYGDMTDSTNLLRLVGEIRPTEIYNLAAQSHVQVSFETPEYTANTDALGTLRMLEAIRILRMEDDIRFYQASTSELFGKVQETPQREKTPFYPRSPYAVAKLYADSLGRKYSGLKEDEAAERSGGSGRAEIEQVFTTNEGPVVITIRDNHVFVAESFPLDLARKLTTLILDAQGTGAMRMARGSNVTTTRAANALPAGGRALSGSMVRFMANCGVLKAVVNATTASVK